ncbi:MAG: gamma-glutamylcyclotransferase family protein [Candidatus Bathyarchaeia archaeon]|jgi:hypothetical protein
MSDNLKSVFSKIAQCSGIALKEYIDKFCPGGISTLRFFSYGSNMNEEKFKEDTRQAGFEFGLVNVKKATLQGYKRILGNRSKRHGLAFTICLSENDMTEGICHDIPIAGLEAFLKKEGVLLDEPSYELLIVRVLEEETPVLTLKGLKPSNVDKLNREQMLQAYCYLCKTLEGAKRWNVNCSDIMSMKENLHEKLIKD